MSQKSHVKSGKKAYWDNSRSVGYRALRLPGLIYIPFILFIGFMFKPDFLSVKMMATATPSPTPSPTEIISLSPEQTIALSDKIKGELLTQITFPMIIAIASIFAAFAVKDGIMIRINDNEKKTIKEELEDGIEDVLKGILKRSDFQRRLRLLEVYVNWLEYESSTTNINKLIESTQKMHLTSEEESVVNRLIREEIIDLSNSSCKALESIRDAFDEDFFVKIDTSNQAVFANSIKSSNLDNKDDELMLIIKNRSSQIFEESFSNSILPMSIADLSESLFKRQLIFLTSKLSEIGEVKLAKENYLYLSTGRQKQRLMRKQQAEIDKANSPTPSLEAVKKRTGI